MAIQLGVAARDAMNDALETSAGVSVQLRIYTGAQPANCAAAATGTLLATLTLPSDWMSASSGGVKSKTGTWTGTSTAAGTAGYFRILNSAGTVVVAQGSITLVTTGTGDMLMDNTNITVGQTITVATFSLTAGNA